MVSAFYFIYLFNNKKFSAKISERSCLIVKNGEITMYASPDIKYKYKFIEKINKNEIKKMFSHIGLF